MSSISGTSSSTSGTLGNAPPVSFPGVSSGIDYNAIIEKYTADTLLQEKPTQAQIASLNAQNAAILKISSLIGAVQDTLTALSDPAAMSAFSATASASSTGATTANASRIAGQTPIPGTYVINAQTAATAAAIINNPLANGALDLTAPLDQAGTSIPVSNGAAANGIVSINGVTINFDAGSQTIGAIVAQIDSALFANDGGSAVLNPDGTVTLTGVHTLGSGGDSGNLLHVLKLDTALLSGGTVTSSAPIGGLNATSVFSQSNNAGFATPVTSGTFTINGVRFSVDATKDALDDVITRINASSAGVVAIYNNETSSLILRSKTPGPQSILLGAGSDSSTFIAATGLSSGTVVAGTQASLTYTDAQGSHTVYSATNDFVAAIPGVDIKVSSSSPSSLPAGSTFYTVTVAPDPKKAEEVIGKFIKAYNAVIVQLNRDTAVPAVQSGHNSSSNIATSKQISAGGVLYGNFSVSRLRDQLVETVSGFIPAGSSAYNSLASVGIVLDTNSVTVGTSDAGDASGDSQGSVSVNATSGQLGELDVAKFEAAYAANTTAVQSLFTAIPKPGAPNAPAGIAFQLGTILANTDGIATFLNHGIVTPANLSSVLLTSITDANARQITSFEQRIALIEREATQQADSLRAQFSASESYIAKLQALQTQIAAIGH